MAEPELMSEQRPSPGGGGQRRPARLPGRRLTLLLRIAGWTLISAGAVVGLYVIYSLFFTNLTTHSAQRDFLESWQRDVGDLAGAAPPSADPDEAPAGGDSAEPAAPPAVEPGAAVAVLQFHRPGAAEPPVHAEPLFVVESVTREALAKGPGHYPQSALPGEEGNFAVAGHRTTFGAPFYHLDELRAGDEIHVTDRSGRRHVYEILDQRIVTPHDGWVIGPDPLETGGRMLTLTTCHPRLSARERLIVFAQAIEEEVA